MDGPEVALHGFHVHIYFDPHELPATQEFAARAKARFGCSVGHFHTRPVGPHPRGSCQLTLSPEQFGQFVRWAPSARGELTLFAHGLSGDDLADHSRHVIWFGQSEPLDLSIFG